MVSEVLREQLCMICRTPTCSGCQWEMALSVENSASCFLLDSQTINLKNRSHCNHLPGSTRVILSVPCLAGCRSTQTQPPSRERVMVMQEAGGALGRNYIEPGMSYKCDSARSTWATLNRTVEIISLFYQNRNVNFSLLFLFLKKVAMSILTLPHAFYRLCIPPNIPSAALI